MKTSYSIVIAIIIVLIFLVIGYNVGEDEEINLSHELVHCEIDDECIPNPSECHPSTCINKNFAEDLKKPEVCTELFDINAAYTPKDCVCGSSSCENKNKNRTVEEYEENLGEQ